MEEIRVFVTGCLKFESVFKNLDTVLMIKERICKDENYDLNALVLKHKTITLDNDLLLNKIKPNSNVLYLLARIDNDLEPKLCKNGCGFFGTVRTKGLCSNCFTTFSETKNSADTISSDSPASEPTRISTIEPTRISTSEPTRCMQCKRKLGIIPYLCKCGHVYCAKHRFEFDHDCQYNHNLIKKFSLEECKPEKIKKI